MTTRVLIPGKPVPKGRPRFSRAGKPYTPAATRQYERRVATVAALNITEQLTGPLEVVIWISFPFLATGEERRRVGDLDNHAKSLLDGLEGIAFTNDLQVQALTVWRTTGSLEGWVAVELSDLVKLAERPAWA